MQRIKLPSKEIFRFKQFEINQKDCAMKVGTDGVLLGAWANVEDAHEILDIGTGTGVIAIMLAQRTPNANVDAVEVNEMACQRANENMKNSPFASRLNSIHDTIQDFAKTTRKEYDLIVCNPPFFTGGTLSTQNGRNNVRHTVKLPHGDLLSSVRRLLKKTGKFCVILPLIEGLRFKELAKTYNFCCNKITEVKPKHDKPVERLLLEFGKKNVSDIKDSLVIQYEKRNDYTEEYIALTKDFYLKM
ncbi:MAG TPA: methyltransferase domain-containing protein [Phaeodactylibacter sp.]|nr:methyltransferase domain-containing protein [Phaeodactylibacter sp.]